MSNLYNYIIRKYAGDGSRPDFREQVGVLEGWASVWINLVLFILKFGMGFWSGSIAVISDAFHTLSDMATSIVIIVGFKISGKAPDAEHPFGHGRVEHVTTIIVGVLLIVTGLEIGKSAVSDLVRDHVIKINFWMIIALVATIIIKEWAGHFSSYLARKIDSRVLDADSWHHRADAISSIVVLVAVVLGANGIPYVDGIVGILVAAFIIYTSFDILLDAANLLIGTVPSEEVKNEITKIASSVPEVLGLHDLVVNDYGTTLVISLHVEIDESISLLRAHTIAERVEDLLRKRTGARATVHLDPLDRGNPLLGSINDLLKRLQTISPDIISIQDIRLIGEPPYQNLIFEVRVSPETDVKSIAEIQATLEREVRKEHPELNDIQIRPDSSIS